MMRSLHERRRRISGSLALIEENHQALKRTTRLVNRLCPPVGLRNGFSAEEYTRYCDALTRRSQLHREIFARIQTKVRARNERTN